MSPLMWMQPRDQGAAARTVWILCAVGGSVTVLLSPVLPHSNQLDLSATVVLVSMISAVAGLCWWSRRFEFANQVAWAMSPFLAVAAIIAVDLLTRDATLVAQIYFVFPVLYGASQLRPAGATALTLASAIGELLVVLALLPAREAIGEAGNVIAVLATTAALLAAAGVRQARLVAELEHLAGCDPLTGLVTRRVFDEEVGLALSQHNRHLGSCLILLDVDNFKTINDRFGHPAGDQVLVQLADTLRRVTRPDDVVCRLGGDEIAVLLPGCPPEVAERRAEVIVEEVRGQVFLSDEGEVIPVSVSVGSAHSPSHAIDLRTLYAKADAALYVAKHSGRDRAATAGTVVS